MPELPAASVTSVSISHVIVRGCAICGHPRQVEQSCAGCGNTTPPTVDNLGVVAAHYRNPIKRAWWAIAGAPLARLRVQRANRRTRKGARW